MHATTLNIRFSITKLIDFIAYTIFSQVCAELGFYAGGDHLPGFNNLKKEDKTSVKRIIP